MTTATLDTTPTRSLGARLGMPGWGRLALTEGTVYLRDLGNLIFVLAFPSLLLLGMSYGIPGMRDEITDAGAYQGLSAAVLFMPVMICVSIATAGLTALPNYLASYRETGVLRRLSTTPMQPQGLLLAQIVVNVVGLLVGAGLAVAAGFMVLGVPAPQNLPLLLLMLIPAVAGIFGIGLIIGGLANKATTASGIGMLVYFPMLFFAGLWTPGPAMPDMVAAIASYTPLGAAAMTLNEAWFTGEFLPLETGMMILWGALTFAIAAKTFRWR